MNIESRARLIESAILKADAFVTRRDNGRGDCGPELLATVNGGERGEWRLYLRHPRDCPGSGRFRGYGVYSWYIRYLRRGKSLPAFQPKHLYSGPSLAMVFKAIRNYLAELP